MQRRGLLAIASVLTAGIVVSVLFLWAADQRWKRAAAIGAELESLRAWNSALQDSLTLMAQRVERAHKASSSWAAQAEAAGRDQRMLLTELDISDLKMKGLQDPVRDLRGDLMKHRDLIPFKGVLGGTMDFVENSITLLSPQWVYAEFEDGHIAGRCLLIFEVAPGGSLSWRVLSATLD